MKVSNLYAIFRVKLRGPYTKVAMSIGMPHGDQGSDGNSPPLMTRKEKVPCR